MFRSVILTFKCYDGYTHLSIFFHVTDCARANVQLPRQLKMTRQRVPSDRQRIVARDLTHEDSLTRKHLVGTRTTHTESFILALRLELVIAYQVSEDYSSASVTV